MWHMFAYSLPYFTYIPAINTDSATGPSDGPVVWKDSPGAEEKPREIGRIAADELISAIENPRATIVKRVVVDAELIEGETIKRIGN